MHVIAVFFLSLLMLTGPSTVWSADATPQQSTRPKLNLEWRWPSKDKPSEKDWNHLDTELAKTRRDDPAQYRVMVIVAQMTLGALGFGTGPFDGVLDKKTRTALGRYQRVRALPQTSDLDGRTLNTLQRDMERYQYIGMLTKLGLPSFEFFDDQWDEGYVMVKGTWTLTHGDRDYVTWVSRFPLQTTTIECRRRERVCVESHAKILYDGSIIGASTDIHTILTWDHAEIRASHEWGCGRYVLWLERTARSVTATCKSPTSEYLVTLVSGIDVTLQLRSEMGADLKNAMQVPHDLIK